MNDSPLPLAWTAPFAWECAIWDPPIIWGDEVIVRAGPRVVALSAATGAELWHVQLPADNLGGEVFVDGGDAVVCDVVIDRIQHLVAVGRDGIRWQRKLAGTLSRHGAVIRGDAIEAVVWVRGKGAHLSRFALATGKEHKSSLPAGGRTLARTGDGLIILSRAAEDGAPGAYLVDADGGIVRVLRTGDTWYGAVVGEYLLTGGTRNGDEYVVEVCDLATGKVRWAEASMLDIAAIDTELVIHAICSKGGGSALVARGTADGGVRWQTSLEDASPATISMAGSVILVCAANVIVVHRDGRLLGQFEGAEGFAGTVGHGRVYVGGARSLLAARLPAA